MPPRSKEKKKRKKSTTTKAKKATKTTKKASKTRTSSRRKRGAQKEVKGKRKTKKSNSQAIRNSARLRKDSKKDSNNKRSGSNKKRGEENMKGTSKQMTAGIRSSSRKGLGRGLSALLSPSSVPVEPQEGLIGTEDTSEKIIPLDKGRDELQPLAEEIGGGRVCYIDIACLSPNPDQPRKDFNENELRELADSISALGVIQPIIARRDPLNPEKFQIVAGERRYRACVIAEVTRIPAIVMELSDAEALELAMIENVQREDLNPIEIAQGYKRLLEELNITQSELAKRVGKDRATIANFIRLLSLPQEIRDLISEGRLTTGHGKALLAIKDPKAQISLARKAVSEGLSVRALEDLIAISAPLEGQKSPAFKGKDVGIGGKRPAGLEELSANFQSIISELRLKYGTKVRIRHSPSGKGRIEIMYFSEDELNRLLELLLGNIE